MAKRALVTGATGLLGRQVKQVFDKADWETVGTGFTRSFPPSVVKLDFGDTKAVATLLDEVK
jgi:S-adenosylmethionine synthetase